MVSTHIGDDRSQKAETPSHREEVLSVLAHDLRGSVADVHAALGDALALLRPTADPDAIALLEDAEHSIGRVVDTVWSMLHVARSGAEELTRESVPLGVLLLQVVERYRQPAHSKHVDLQLSETPGDLPWVRGDGTVLSVILDNLISNAVKYSPPDSTVRISVTTLNSTVQIAIADQGCGIPDHEQVDLFTRPGRLSPVPTAGEHSMGLGLHLSARLAKRMDASISYQHGERGGSVFVLHCPASDGI